MNKKTYIILLSCAVVLIVTLFLITSRFPKVDGTKKTVTLNEIYNNKITSFIDKPIFLKTKIVAGIDTLMVSNNEYVLKQINSPYIYNETDKIDRANFIIESDKLNKLTVAIPPSNSFIPTLYSKTIFTFKGKPLWESKEYILEGTLKYRDWLKVDNSKLKNPQFIDQSNKPEYWSQTFEFELENIYEAI